MENKNSEQQSALSQQKLDSVMSQINQILKENKVNGVICLHCTDDPITEKDGGIGVPCHSNSTIILGADNQVVKLDEDGLALDMNPNPLEGTPEREARICVAINTFRALNKNMKEVRAVVKQVKDAIEDGAGFFLHSTEKVY